MIGGAASEGAAGGVVGGGNWGGEHASNAALRRLKLRLLDLIAPCRAHALLLPERTGGRIATTTTTGGGVDGTDGRAALVAGGGDDAPPPVGGGGGSDDGAGTSRTVALMVLLCGDADPDVRRKADSYLRAHMDAHRGKDVPRRP